jgi:peptidyl-prolyl cis-trans isomerase A (cyclophilin A)
MSAVRIPPGAAILRNALTIRGMLKFRWLIALLVFAPLLVAQDEGGEATEEKPEAKEEVQAPTSTNPVAVIKTSMGEIHVELFEDECPKTVANFLGLATGTKEFTDPQTKEKVKRPFYDGLIFHRVIKGFVIQGGCPLGNGRGGPGYRFEDEINANDLGLDKMKVIEGGRPHPWLQIRDQRDFQMKVIMPLVKQMGYTTQAEIQANMEAINQKLQATVPNLTVKDFLENLGYEYHTGHKSHAPKKGVIAMANSGPNTNGSQFFITLDDTPPLTGKHTVFGHVIKGMDVVEKIGEVQVGEGAKPVEDVKIVSIRRLESEGK